MNKVISVALADDHALVREMLRERLNAAPDIDVVAAAPSADGMIETVSRLGPDVVILDIDMPGMCCFEAARAIRVARPKTRIIFLSSFSNDAYIEQALGVEAAGYLTKGESPEVVVEAIRCVSVGRRHFSEDVESRIVLDESGIRLASGKRARISTLTSRELEILRYVARGLSQKEIAHVTNRSDKTIHKHCNNIMGKLDIHDRVALARFAIREGLAEP